MKIKNANLLAVISTVKPEKKKNMKTINGELKCTKKKKTTTRHS